MAHSPEILREMKSGAMGQFEFTGLEPGTYVVTVSHSDMAAFVSKPVELSAEKPVIMPNVVLQVAGATTSVTVMDKESASIEQVEISKQQRVFKVFPNFYSSFDWNAPPLMTKQKYHLAARTLIDPVTFLTTAAVAGVQQYGNVFPSFGTGIEGYGTDVTLSNNFVSALKALGVNVGQVNPTTLSRMATFPITGGVIDLDTAIGNIVHSGGLTFSGGTTTVRIQSFIIDTTGKKPAITGIVVVDNKVWGRFRCST